MIKLNEFRIGIIINDNYSKVIRPFTMMDYKRYFYNPESILYFTGVPLNEKILLDFGFKHGVSFPSDAFMKLGDFEFSVDKDSDDEELQIINFTWKNKSLIGHDVKYVHQLQNVYQALTGEELTIK